MGIFDELNNSEHIVYESLTKESISKIMDSVSDSIKRLPSQRVFYMGELSFINYSVMDNNTDLAKQINKLFSYLPYYYYIEKLYDIKFHHITVGYSTMTIEECNIKNRHFINKRNDIENKIKELYYGKR